MNITFHGGVRTVTGSKHLLELPDCRLLLECGLSTHADRDELLDYMRGMSSPPRTVYIVHGDEKQSLAYASHLQGEGFNEVHVPHEGDSFDLLSGRQVGGH